MYHAASVDKKYTWISGIVIITSYYVPVNGCPVHSREDPWYLYERRTTNVSA